LKNQSLISDWRKMWFWALAAFSCFLVTVTFLMGLGIHFPMPFMNRGTFNLQSENSLAAWFSGMMLFVAAMHAFDGFIVNQGIRKGPASAWLIISSLMAVLSLDEVGSLHERADNNIAPLMGKSIPLEPFQIAIIGLLVFSFYCLWRHREYRRQVAWMSIGCMILATVPFQERMEHAVDWGNSRLAFSSRTISEEGSELLGILIILKACLPNSGRILTGSPTNPAPVLALASHWRKLIAVLSLFVLIPIFTLFSAFIDEAHPRGYPASWLASVFLLAAGISAFRAIHGSRNRRRLTAIVAYLCVLGSVGFVDFAVQDRAEAFLIGEISTRMLFLAILSIPMGVIWLSDWRYSRRYGVLFLVFILIAAMVSIRTSDPIILFGLPCLYSLLVYYVNGDARLSEQKEPL
jgi:hypothetical protein